MEIKGLGEVGDFCPHEECDAYGKKGSGTIILYGQSKQGVQRYYCKVCKRAFNANYGTLFYRRRKSETEIIEVLSLLAKGTSISAITETKGYKSETIDSWLKEAALHAKQVTDILLTDYELEASQIDGLWSYVGHKAAKKGSKKRKPKEASGVALS